MIRILLKPFTLVLALALFIVTAAIKGAAMLASFVSFWILLLFGIFAIIAIVEKMWNALLTLGIIFAVLVVLFFGSALVCGFLEEIRDKLLEF